VARLALEGKGVLLTGASSGIGRALAWAFARRGARLAIAARREASLAQVADEIESAGCVRPYVLRVDLSRRDAAAELGAWSSECLGGVDVLVNNAGGGGVGGTQWQVGDRAEGREAFELNFWSPLALTAALVPAMRRAGSGAVVNVSSMAQFPWLWQLGHYSATKAALAQATEALRMELYGSGVNVLEVIPGLVETALQGEMALIPGAEKATRGLPMGAPDKLAKRVVHAIEQGRARLVYPRVLRSVYAMPWLARLNAAITVRRLADEIVPNDPRVLRYGSSGDAAAKQARSAWYDAHPGGR
jgi:uncharacterized protein